MAFANEPIARAPIEQLPMVGYKHTIVSGEPRHLRGAHHVAFKPLALRDILHHHARDGGGRSVTERIQSGRAAMKISQRLGNRSDFLGTHRLLAYEPVEHP